MPITGGPARMALKALMPQFVRLGLSANQSLRQFQRMGYGVRRQTFLKDFRETAHMERAAPAFQSVPRTLLPTQDAMASWDMGDAPEYRVFGRALFIDPETGERVEKYVSIYDDYVRSKEGYTEALIDQFGDRFQAYRQKLFDVVWTQMAHNTAYE